MNRQLNAVQMDITVLLGRTHMPVQQLLRMGRGARIALNSRENDNVWILANGHPVGRGELFIDQDKVSVRITGAAQTHDYFAGN